MARNAVSPLSICVLTALLLVAPGVSLANGKAAVLSQLTSASRAQLGVRAATAVATCPEASQIALDLIVYRWACKLMGDKPDARNIDDVITALVKQLNDPTVSWALYLFTTASNDLPSPMPPRDDERVDDLSSLRIQVKSALDFRESSPIEAVNSLNSAIQMCQRLYLDISEAFLLKELGDHYLYRLTRYRQAEVCYDRATRAFAAYGCTRSCAVVYDDWGTLNTELGRYSSATQNYVEAARQWEALARQNPTGCAYRDLAGRAYIKAGEAQRAAGDSDKALELMNDHGLRELRLYAYTRKSYTLLVHNLLLVAAFRRERGELPKTLELLKEAEKAATAERDLLLLARVYHDLAHSYSAANNSQSAATARSKRVECLRKAIVFGEAALARLGKNADIPREEQARLVLVAERSAAAYSDKRNPAQAAECWKRLCGYYRKSGNIDGEIRALRSVADFHDQLGKYVEALEARRDAVLLAMRSNRKLVAADIVRDMIRTFIARNDLPNALEAFTELVPIIERSGNLRGVAGVIVGKGTLLASNGQHEEAVRHFADAASRYIVQIGDPWAAGEVAIEMANSLRALNRNTEAIKELESVLHEIEVKYLGENLGTSTSLERVRIVQSLYKELASLYIHEELSAKAIALLREAKRYEWVAELIAALKNSGDEKVSLFVEKLDLVGDGNLSQVPDTPGHQKIIASDRPGVYDACRRLSKLYQSNYNALPIDPMDLLRFRASIPKDTLVIEYLPTGSSLFVFIFGFDKSLCMEIAARRESLDAVVARLRRSVLNCEEGLPVPPIRDWQESSFLDIKEPLDALYAQLVAPIRQQIEKRTRLVFALPNELAGLPMHALISTGSRQVPRFLIEDFEVSYLARGTFDDLISRDSRPIDPNTDRLAIFADPEGNLPGAQQEARNIKNAYFNSVWYVGNEASPANFLKECITSSIIHIAAHHRISRGPSGFELLLAPVKDSDGRLDVQQLVGMENVRLAMVVLSSCDSISSSDPISTAPSAAAELFSLAGARSVLGGLWKVSDESASKLMGDFYRDLSRGKSRSESLRRAQVGMIESKRFAHPFYWGCFALYGNPR